MQVQSQRINDFKESIFATISKEAHKQGAINLGQGAPDFDGPEWLKDKVRNCFELGMNQYAPAMGVLNLRESLGQVYKEFYDLDYNPQTQINITCGATEAIFSSILALINPGDEVIVFEPFYDSYVASIKIAGGMPVPVTLKKPKFELDFEQLNDAVSGKTKLLIINTPHNPSGKIFSEEQMLELAKFCQKNDLVVLSDEVYEHLVFDGKKHRPTASYPGMKDRTVTISSSGKTFGMTGWKIGWLASSEELVKNIGLLHQFNTFSIATPFQFAIADALKKLNEYLPEFRADYTRKRDILFSGLEQAGLCPIKPDGTYFIFGDITNQKAKDDIDFCMNLIRTKKVAAIPPSAFYLKSDEGTKLVRYCFAKEDETLHSAIKNLN